MMSIMSVTLSVMTASISSSSRDSPSFHTAAERKGTCKNCCKKTTKLEIVNEEDKDDNNDDEDDLGPPVDQPGVGEQLVAQAGHSATAAMTPFKHTSTYIGAL